VSSSKWEALLEMQLKAAKIPYEREFQAIPERRFRWDFCCQGFPQDASKRFIPTNILVEIQGGIWKKMAHSSGTGITRDAEKQSLAAIHGFRVILATGAQVKSGQCLQWIEQALGVKR